ncbi:MAG: cupin domain-containing protein [Pseudomonadota bacterium]
MSDENALIRPAESQPEWRVLDDRLRVLATLAQTDGQYELFVVDGPEGSGPPPHRHPWEEAFFVTDGELDVQVGEIRAHVAAGDYVRIPAHTTHTFRVTTPQARFLALTLPAEEAGRSASGFFETMHREIPFPPPSFEAVCAVAERNGVTLG